MNSSPLWVMSVPTQPEEITEEEFDRQLAESQPVEIVGPVQSMPLSPPPPWVAISEEEK